MMASGKNAKKTRKAKSVPVVSQRQGLPWLTIGAVGVIVALAVVIGIVVINSQEDKNEANAALVAWEPSAENPDPSVNISGIYVGAEGTYAANQHVTSTQRVAYDRIAENLPPVGGPHDATWAACNGVVYSVAVRNENMVHPLEHGAIWITYNPDTISSADLDTLTDLVNGQPFMMLSPYPNLASTISLQSWGHQLEVDSASDERIMQFITALRQNPNVYPEVGATCSQPSFPIDNPPPFDATAPGADAIPLSGEGATAATGETDAASMTSVDGAGTTDVSGTETATTEASVSGSTVSGSTDTADTETADTGAVVTSGAGTSSTG